MDQEMMKAIDKINYELWELLGNGTRHLLSYTYYTHNDYIEFSGHVVYCSENMCRPTVKDGNTPEDWEPLLRRRVNNLMQEFKKVKL